MSGVTMDALPHSPTGLWGSQARKVEMKIVSSWLRGMKFIRVNGKSNDAMTKMSLFVGKLFEHSTAWYRYLRQWRKLAFPEGIILSTDVGRNQISSPFPRGVEDTRRKVH